MIKLSVYDNLGVWVFVLQLVLFIAFLFFFFKYIVHMLEKKNNMKFGVNQYWKPTPKKVRKVADSLSAAALAVSAFTFVQDYKVVSYVVLASAFIGKFLSNLFAEEPVEKSNSL